MDDYSEYGDQCIIEIQKRLSQPDSAYKLHKNIRDYDSEKELAETFILLNDLKIVCKNAGTNIFPDYIVQVKDSQFVHLEITLISSEIDDAASLNSQLSKIIKLIESKITKDGEWWIYLNKFSKKQERKLIENISTTINTWEESRKFYRNDEYDIVYIENNKENKIVPGYKKLALTKKIIVELINKRIDKKSEIIRKARDIGKIELYDNWLLITLHDDAVPDIFIDEVFDFQEFKKVFWIYDLPNLADKQYRYGEFSRKVF
jgi:hypothetical protein